MRKEEYLALLKQELSQYPETFQKDLIDSFEEHFQAGLEEGRSEEEIMADLGDINEVVDNIRMMNGEASSYTQQEDTVEQFKSSIAQLSNDLKDTVQSFTGIVNDGVQRMKDIHWDNSGKNYYEDDVINTSDVDHISISSSIGGLDVEITPGDELHYDFHSLGNIFTKNTPSIDVEIKNRTAHFNLRFENASFLSSAQLDLTIPSSIKKIESNLLSGDVEISDLALDTLDIHSTSGDVDIDHTSCKEVNVKCTSGDIDLEYVQVERFQLNSTSGDIDLSHCDGLLDCKCVSGDIDVENCIAPSTQLESFSGDIDASLQSPVVYASSMSGDVEVEFLEEIEDARVTSQSGDVLVRCNGSNFQATLSTISGDIENRTKLPTVEKTSHRMVVNDGEATITISSKSGDVTIR